MQKKYIDSTEGVEVDMTASVLIPAGLVKVIDETFDVALLPPFLRVLLTTDGTVTKSLEAYFWETITVSSLGQSYSLLPEDEPCLDKPAGTTVLRRKVRLEGATSGTCYASAESIICTTELPERVRKGLEEGQYGIGEILRDCGLETYRRLVDVGRCYAEPAGEEPPQPTGEIWRRYQICIGGKPFMLIKEFFPLAVYTRLP